MPRPNRSSRSASGRARSRLFGAKTERSPTSATDRNPDRMEPGERMDNSQKTVLLMLFDDRVSWTLDELGRKSCDGERIPREKLETAVFSQLRTLYRDGGLIREAIEQAAARSGTRHRPLPRSL